MGDEARDRREELIRIYHNQFSIILNQLGYLKKIPSLLDLQVELLQNGVIGEENIKKDFNIIINCSFMF